MNRKAQYERRKRNSIIERGAQKGRAPGAPSFATPTSSTSGTATISPGIEGTVTMPDENNNTLHPFILGVDTLNSDTARL